MRMLFEKNLDRWLGGYFRHLGRRALAGRCEGVRHLMFACETGILGLMAALLLFGALIRAVYKGYRSALPGPERDLLLALLASICGFMVNMVTWDALNQPTVRMTFWMLVGIAFCQLRLVSAEREKAEPANEK